MDQDLKLWAFARMRDLGWMPEDADFYSPAFSMDAAIVEYQSFHGLAATGVLDAATQEHLQAMRFCGLPDQYTVGELRAAPIPGLWRYVGSLPTVTDADARAEIQRSFDKIARVCSAWAREAQTGETPNVVIRAVRIDGRNGVLADMYLPGPMPQNGRLDTSEVYTIAVPIPAGRIGLGNVCTHELIHWAGVGHLQEPGNLMNPIYNPQIDRPQSGDSAALRAIYPGGPHLPPEAPPTPTPTPMPTPTPGLGKVTVDIYGASKIDIFENGRLQKVTPKTA